METQQKPAQLTVSGQEVLTLTQGIERDLDGLVFDAAEGDHMSAMEYEQSIKKQLYKIRRIAKELVS